MHIKITKKNIKKSYLKVKPDLSVDISVPEDATEEYINFILEKRTEWIEKQQNFFKEFRSVLTEKKNISGECVKYLGKNYRLKVHLSEEEHVKFYRGYVHLHCFEDSTVDLKKELLESWLKERAKEKILNIAKKYLDELEEQPQIKFRDMKTRWGSCNSEKKRIIFNWKLIEKSSYGIEYVVVHELSHLKYDSHDKNFFRYLAVQLPDWEKRRDSLYM